MDNLKYDLRKHVIFSKALIDKKYKELYSMYDEDLAMTFAYLHCELNKLLELMNNKADKGRYPAEKSRKLIEIIDNESKLEETLSNTKYSFNLNSKYDRCLKDCSKFLKKSYGSKIPKEYNKIKLIDNAPIFTMKNLSYLSSLLLKLVSKKIIGKGAYATVYSFIDPISQEKYAEKKLNRGANEKELERFKLEYSMMKSLSNYHILKVYSYNDEDNSYIMEYCNYTLRKYIDTYNGNPSLNFELRKDIALQFLCGMEYIYSKHLLHRDICPNNVLIKEYDNNSLIIKISDFGLVKNKDLNLTTTSSSMKGTIIDPTLTDFKNYDIINEIYSIGYILLYIFTGTTNTSKLERNSELYGIIDKCINNDTSKRFQNVNEIASRIKKLGEHETIEKKIQIKNNAEQVNQKNETTSEEKADIILKAMVKDKTSGLLYHIKTLDSDVIETSDGKFLVDILPLSPREKASWKSALDKLINEKLIELTDYKNEIFEVTEKGYKYYDESDFFVQII